MVRPLGESRPGVARKGDWSVCQMKSISKKLVTWRNMKENSGKVSMFHAADRECLTELEEL